MIILLTIILLLILYKLKIVEYFKKDILYNPLPFMEKPNDYSINYKKRIEGFDNTKLLWEDISQIALKNARNLNN
jgi:hypothetical protein